MAGEARSRPRYTRVPMLRKRPTTQPTEVRVPNAATYWPVAPLDLVAGTPLVARLLLGATPLGRAVQVAVVGAYLGSAFRDWRARQAIRRIDFHAEFGADIDRLVPMPAELREAEIRRLAARLNDERTTPRWTRQELAVEVDRRLTDYIAAITGQYVRTSVEVRNFTLARLAFPFALGACDVLSGDVAIFQDTGCFEPHIIAHEFAHRKGYLRELHAQVLAYLALVGAEEPALRRAALLERLYRDIRVLAGEDTDQFRRLVTECGLRPELRAQLLRPRRPSGPVSRRVATSMHAVYDVRLRLTGQNGTSDYDLGFTNFLYTFETSRTARQNAPRI